MKLGEGSLLGPYRVISELGRGGMATVYKAHQDSLSRYVAIKVLPEFFAEEPGFKERFKQEAVAVAKRFVELKEVAGISPETVRPALKKTS